MSEIKFDIVAICTHLQVMLINLIYNPLLTTLSLFTVPVSLHTISLLHNKLQGELVFINYEYTTTVTIVAMFEKHRSTFRKSFIHVGDTS